MSTEIDKLVSSTSDQNQTIIRILDIIYRKTTQEKGNFNLPKQISSVMTAFNTEISNANKMNSYYAIIKMANENIIDDEITKSVPEILNWINSHKSISKSATVEWKKFIDKYLKYGNHSLSDIFYKVKNENLEKKLTSKMLIDLEKFYTQQ